MLLQFAVENYLSFRDRAVLSMLADPRVKHEAGQVLVAPDGREVVRAAAVYGANGSGKSNLVDALGAVSEMVLKGTRGEEHLPVVPFKLDAPKRNEPSHFEMELVAGGKHYSYGFEATTKRIDAEWLYENDPSGEERLLFERDAGSDKPIIKIGEPLSADPKRRGFLEYVADGTRQNQLFMAEAGERNVTELQPLRAAIQDWRIARPDTAVMPMLLDRIEKLDSFRQLLNDLLKEAGTGIDGLRVVVEPSPIKGSSATAMTYMRKLNPALANEHRELRRADDGSLTMARLVGAHRGAGEELVELDFSEESDGTRRLLNLAPIVYLADVQGPEPLFAIDELERSLHPLLSRMLLQLFFARAGAGAAAQIIFTTHDTNLLNRNLLSRDSVWFMEKDVRGGSILYPLSDLDQGQLDEVEKQGNGLEKGYLQGRFGAIPFFGSLESLGFRKDLLK